VQLVNPGIDSWTATYVFESSTKTATVLPGTNLTVLAEQVDFGSGMVYLNSDSLAVRSVGVSPDTYESLLMAPMHGAYMLAGIICGIYIVDQLGRIFLPLKK